MDIIAHRGASTYAPENTLASFKKAIELGADCIELDVRLSKDKVPVIIHDASVNRTSQNKGFIHNLSLDELKKFDFGSRFSSDFCGEEIPTLKEVLELVSEHDIDLNIELKNGPTIPKELEENVLRLVNHFKLEDRTLFSSFDHKSLYRLSLLNKHLHFALIFHINLVDFFSYLDTVPFDVKAIHPNHFYVTKAIVEEAHRRDMLVNCYTVNNKALAKKYENLGVDGLITNDPLILK